MTERGKVIKFGSDTKHRKQWFTGISFSHPAKMSLPLQLWIIDNFTKEGETILDPMAGSGTILVACSMGRHVITVELEDKFVQMQKDNWVKVKQRGPQLGYSLGNATILQGDARDLKGLLVDKCVFSPPHGGSGEPYYSSAMVRIRQEIGRDITKPSQQTEGYGNAEGQIGQLPYGDISTIITSPAYGDNPGTPSLGSVGKDDWGNEGKDIVARRGLERGYSKDTDGQVNNLPYGSIDAVIDCVISSPPYEESMGAKHHSPRADKLAKEKSNPVTYTDKVDAVISSPPYEGIKQDDKRANDPEQIDRRAREFEKAGGNFHTPGRMATIARHYSGYASSSENIGNLKSDSYLSAMGLVYQGCYSVLRDGGLLILVTKNFIRNKKQVRLDLDTVKLCEQAGFTFQDRWYRELQAQSFWRTIYYQKYPEVEPIKYEDVLIFVKQEL